MLCGLPINLSNWINFHTLLRKINSKGQHSTVRGKRFEWTLTWWNVCPVRLYVWRALRHPSQISTVDSQLDIFTPKQFSTSESLVLTIRKLSFCDFFPQTMQSAFDLLTPSTLYTIIKSNSTKLLERRTAMFYLALGEKTPRRCIAADIAMRKHGVAHAQAKCPSASVYTMTGLKNRWLAENAFQQRVRKTIIADLLRGLEAAQRTAPCKRFLCWSMKYCPLLRQF